MLVHFVTHCLRMGRRFWSEQRSWNNSVSVTRPRSHHEAVHVSESASHVEGIHEAVDRSPQAMRRLKSSIAKHAPRTTHAADGPQNPDRPFSQMIKASQAESAVIFTEQELRFVVESD